MKLSRVPITLSLLLISTVQAAAHAEVGQAVACTIP